MELNGRKPTVNIYQNDGRGDRFFPWVFLSPAIRWALQSLFKIHIYISWKGLVKNWYSQKFWNPLGDLAEPWIFIIVSLIWKCLQLCLTWRAEKRKEICNNEVHFHSRRMTSLLPETAEKEGRVSCRPSGGCPITRNCWTRRRLHRYPKVFLCF